MSLRAPRVASAVLAAAALAFTSGCDDDGDPAVALATTTVTVQLVAGANLYGLTLDLRHSSSFAVVDVDPAGPLAHLGCQSNPEDGRLRASCVASQPFGAPATAWTVTFQHPENESVAGAVTSLTCQGAGQAGDPVAATCALDT